MASDNDDLRIKTPWLRILSPASGGLTMDGDARAVIGHQLPPVGADRPAGVYAEWAWDGHQLDVRNDRFGMGQLLYGLLPGSGGIVLSPHLEHHAELGVPTEPDDGALSVLIRLGFLLGRDTPFKSVRALPVNASLRWTPQDFSVTGQPVVPPERATGRDAAVSGYAELFRQSMARRPLPPGQSVLPLTGGQDSRHILFELCHAKTPPELCVTVRTNPAAQYDDAAVAHALAQALNVRHEIILPQRSAVDEDFRKYRRIGVMSDEGGWTSILLDRIRRFQGAYDGIGGDMLSSGYLAGIEYDERVSRMVEGRDWEALAQHILAHFSASEEALAPLLRDLSYHDLGRDYVLSRLVAELAQFNDAGHPLAMFIIHNRTRREIAMMSWLMCAEVPTYYAPYLDDDLFDFLAALPAREFACGQWFHREVIRKTYPSWAELPYLDKRRIDRPGLGLSDVVGSILKLRRWAKRNTPGMTGTVSRWGMHRLVTRAARSSAPRRVVQHALVIEQLLRRWRTNGAG